MRSAMQRDFSRLQGSLREREVKHHVFGRVERKKARSVETDFRSA
jgi:hypothetical protein